MKYLSGFFTFLYDFIIGDSWQISLGVIGVILATRFLTIAQPNWAGALQPLFLLALILVFCGVLLNETRS